MKLTRKTILLLMTLAVAPGVFAQSNGVPGPADFDRFSQFIANRNIFDPQRQPHYSGQRTRIRPRIYSSSAPFLSLVGVMSYNKGIFAFFNGSDDDLKQVLPVSGKIAGYTVAEVTPGSVKLVSDDKKQTLDLKIGDVLRQEDGRWGLSQSRELPEQSSSSGPASGNGSRSSNSSENSSSTDNSAVAPSADMNSNEILKRLMELRAKENQ